jgi:hypothetical protein
LLVFFSPLVVVAEVVLVDGTGRSSVSLSSSLDSVTLDERRRRLADNFDDLDDNVSSTVVEDVAEGAIALSSDELFALPILPFEVLAVLLVVLDAESALTGDKRRLALPAVDALESSTLTTASEFARMFF